MNISKAIRKVLQNLVRYESEGNMARCEICHQEEALTEVDVGEENSIMLTVCWDCADEYMAIRR